jgi:hypothetical protein
MEPCTIGNKDCRASVSAVQRLVEHHHDVASQRHLDIDGRFRRKHVPVAIEVRLKRNSPFGDLAQIAQAENLVAARVGENGARPRHEAVQPAQAADQLMTGPQEQVIGVGQQDANVQVLGQIPLSQTFDGGLRSHGHEYGRVDGSMRRVQHPGARTGLVALGH